MPTLEEISEQGAASAEKLIRESKAIDYAWLKDSIAHTRGETPHYLHDFIDAQYAKAIGEFDGGS